MDDNRLYLLLMKNNDYQDNKDAFKKAVKEAFRDDMQLADYIIELHALGIVGEIDDALELNQDVMDALIDILEKQDEERISGDKRVARKAIRMWFSAYGEDMLGLFCSMDDYDEVEIQESNEIVLDEYKVNTLSLNESEALLRKTGTSNEGRTIREWLVKNEFELPITLIDLDDDDVTYVLQTIKDNCVYAEVFQSGKSSDYCRFNIDTKELFMIKED